MATIDETWVRLSKSEFRAKFHLSEKDRKYIAEKVNIPDYFTPPVRSLGTTIPVYGYH